MKATPGGAPESCGPAGRLLLWILPWALLWSGLASGTAGAEDTAEDDAFRSVVRIHLDSYPAMLPVDFYKLAFQGALGNEHAVPTRDQARAWLERELASLSPAVDEPFCMPLTPDGSLVRVNLREFVARNGRPEGLLDAFLTTAERFIGSTDRLESYWRQLEAMAVADEIPAEPGQLTELFDDMRGHAFPAVRHSATFKELYAPAYRVILAELVPEMIGGGCRADRSGSSPP